MLIDDHPDYAEVKAAGGFVKDESGEPVVEQFWDGMGSYLDFTKSGHDPLVAGAAEAAGARRRVHRGLER